MALVPYREELEGSGVQPHVLYGQRAQATLAAASRAACLSELWPLAKKMVARGAGRDALTPRF